MNGSCDQFLTSAALSGDQYSYVLRRDAINAAQKRANSRAAAHNPGISADLFLQKRVNFFEGLYFAEPDEGRELIAVASYGISGCSARLHSAGDDIDSDVFQSCSEFDSFLSFKWHETASKLLRP